MRASRVQGKRSSTWLSCLRAAALSCAVVVNSASGVTVTEGAVAASQARADAAGTLWLCRRGQSPDPYTASLDTTVVEPDGTRHVVHYLAATDPPIDCFSVYPNITLQTTPNANLEVDPQETAIAQLEASPFSQDCRVFAPMYRDSTGSAKSPAARTRAF